MVTICTKLNTSFIIQPINIKFCMWVSYDYENMLMYFFYSNDCATMIVINHVWCQWCFYLINMTFLHLNLLLFYKKFTEKKMCKGCANMTKLNNDWSSSWMKFIMVIVYNDWSTLWSMQIIVVQEYQLYFNKYDKYVCANMSSMFVQT